MEENKKGMTSPQWVNDAAEWQKADEENRGILIIATEGLNGMSGCGGDAILLTSTAMQALKKDPGFKKVFKDVMEISSDPEYAMAFGIALDKFKKARGYDKE